jgi:hypothetical protein
VNGAARELDLDGLVPRDLEEFVRLILVYGFLMPGRRGSFWGWHYLPRRHIRSNVSRKIASLDDERFDAAFSWLARAGVLLPYHKPGTADLWRLNPHEEEAAEEGMHVIARIKTFARWLSQQTR